MNPDSALRLFSALVYFWQLIWAGRTFRLPKGERPTLRHYLVPLAYMFVLVSGMGPTARPEFLIPGAVGLAAALALFEWARRSIRGRYFSFVYSRDTPEFLWTGGPFAYIRNPFYASYMLSAGSVTLMHPHPPQLVGFALLVVVSSGAARHEEHKFHNSPLNDAYQTYAGKTGRFIPGVGRLRAENQDPT